MAVKKPRAETYEGTEKYEAIQTDLMNQLEAAGTTGEYYADLIRDYMGLWVTKCMLLEDIRTRGIYISYNNGGGQSGTRKNDSVLDILKVSAQMLKLLDAMGVKPSQSDGGGDDEL